MDHRMRDGDLVTMSGNWPNPDRRWWQFWKPRKVWGERVFQVSKTFTSELSQNFTTQWRGRDINLDGLY